MRSNVVLYLSEGFAVHHSPLSGTIKTVDFFLQAYSCESIVSERRNGAFIGRGALPVMERKALASAGFTLLSKSEASHTYMPTSALVGLVMVKRRPKEPTPLATSTPFLRHTKLSLSTGLWRTTVQKL